MKKLVPLINCLRNVLTREEFEKLVRYFDMELFQLKPTLKTIFLDNAEKLRAPSLKGALLFSLFEQENHFLFLHVTENGQINEWKDILYPEEYNALQDNGKLPSAEHSNVARKLKELGIFEPIDFAGDMNEELADVTSQFQNDVPAGVKIYLERVDFPGGKRELQLIIGYENDKTAAGKIFDKILSDNTIDRKPAEHDRIEKFFETNG